MLKVFESIEKNLLHCLLKRCAVRDPYGMMEFVDIIKTYERYASNFITYGVYPKKTDNFKPSSIVTPVKEGEFAIVLQGPIATKDEFTLETIKLYRIIFPKANVIVSTWDDTSKALLDQIRMAGAHVIINKVFKPNGFGNVNYQIATSLSGAKKAKELGAIFTIKSRTDSRIYCEHALEYMKSLLQIFPIQEDNIFHLKGRILTGGGGRANFCMPYWIQDFLYFGYTDDIINFFSSAYDERQIDDRVGYAIGKLGPHHNGKAICSILPPEVYLTLSFISKYKKEEQTIENHWSNIKEIFITINPEDINMFWPKYDKLRNQTINDFYEDRNQDDSYKAFRFQDWINIYNNQYVYHSEYEKLCENRFL